MFKTMCQIDITYYPFDEQKCDLVFGAWSYYTTKMNLTTESTAVTMDSFETNGEWDVTNTQVRLVASVYRHVYGDKARTHACMHARVQARNMQVIFVCDGLEDVIQLLCIDVLLCSVQLYLLF